MLETEHDPISGLRSDSEELAEIIMQMHRRFLPKLSEELSRGSVSFPQYFLLGYLENHQVMTMTAIAAEMGHTTAAASGLVDRLEKLGYVERCHTVNDRRKVMVRNTPKGSGLVAQIRHGIVERIMTILRDQLTVEEGKNWLQIYRKIAAYCENSPKHD
ncbi:MAG: MarR family transcriptional regulator [Verrucomicrobia bacterium]|nr:MarR family transcriptional regulator [Verrucomicrobiota bacterium]MBV9672820.1 MarR family transcriptional regulator [Verrucomicrobiota bacterium]